VTSDVVANSTSDSGSLAGLAGGYLAIHKATPTATLAVTNSPQPYNGSGQAATVGVSASSVSGTVANISTGGAATKTNAGTYAVTADFVPNDTTNYKTLTGLAAGDFVIQKANATFTVTPYTSLTTTYDGHSHTAAVTSITGVNGETGATVGTVDVSHTTHINAGTYTSDYWFFTGGTNYNDIGNTTIIDSIKKADAVVAVSGYSGTYDGFPHGASGSVTGVDAGGAALGTTLNLGATFTNYPGGTASWTFTGGTNYNDQSGSVLIVINKATAVIVITPYHVTSNTTSHTATGTVTGVDAGGAALGTTLDLSGTTHTDAGEYPADPWSFSGGTNYYDANGTVHDIIDKAHLTVTAQPATVQYSDPLPTFTYAITGFISPDTVAVVSGSPAFSTAAVITFYSGTGGVSNAPGAYTNAIIPSLGTLSASNYDFPTANFVKGTVTVTPEDARPYYTGPTFVNTSGPTSTMATVTLSATIKDITPVDPSASDPHPDNYPGVITNAKVTFINRDTNTVLASNVPVGLVNAGDSTVGTATYNWTVNISPNVSQQYTIGIIVTNYYTRNSSFDDDVVTVSVPPAAGSITGGGYLVMSNSAGLYPGGVGTKNNFGFNCQNTKSGVKGNINTIIRNNGRVYQIKGNSMTSLTTNPITSTTGTATFNGKANIQDITNPNAPPISIDGNATLQVSMADNGEPGSNDTISITVFNKSGGVWFTSNWNGTTYVQQKIGGGNLQVR